jgi:osmotically-inducible protein OsmY
MIGLTPNLLGFSDGGAMKKFLILSLMFVVSLQIGCSRDRDYRTEAAREPAVTDSQLEQQVQNQFASDPALKGTHLNVDADAEHNMITLSGTVESDAQRNAAMLVARNANQGLVVNNQIKVKPRELSRSEWTEEHSRSAAERASKFGDKVGNTLDDTWIHTKITTKLIGDSDTSAREINVDVNNSTVTLRGTVDTAAEKAEAERIAMETDGVRHVNNQLKVKTTAPTR